MALLYYWRGDNYRRDLDVGAGYHLNHANPVLHETAIGSSLWAFTRRSDGSYVLAAELVVKAKTFNPIGYRYGRYRVWGDLRLSRYFNIDGQPDITYVIRSLSISARGDVLGRAFQGYSSVRRLGDSDNRIVTEYARRLPLEPRAHLLPEEHLEALLVSGDEDAVSVLLRDEPSGVDEERRRYLHATAVKRDRKLVEKLLTLYQGRCQICGWESRSRYNVDVCEAHHVQWLSRGGNDDLSNLVLICPNHHRIIHHLDAPFDFDLQGFVFSTNVEPITHAKHQLAP